MSKRLKWFNSVHNNTCKHKTHTDLRPRHNLYIQTHIIPFTLSIYDAIVWSADMFVRVYLYICVHLYKFIVRLVCSLSVTFVCFVITNTTWHLNITQTITMQRIKWIHTHTHKTEKRRKKKTNCLIAFDIKWLHVIRINNDLLGIINGACLALALSLSSFLPSITSFFLLFYLFVLFCAIAFCYCHASIPKMW